MNDSGDRVSYPSAAIRESQRGRSRPDLIPVEAISAWGDWMALGAEKYSDRNWEHGMPLSRYEAGLWRHLVQYMLGDRSEDHLSAVLFNTGCIIHHEQNITSGRLSEELDDRPAMRRLKEGN